MFRDNCTGGERILYLANSCCILMFVEENIKHSILKITIDLKIMRLRLINKLLWGIIHLFVAYYS